MSAQVGFALTSVRARSAGLTLPVYVATIALSAFLLFSIQPMFTKLVLPRLGGSPGVWSVAMVFFQAVLLAGYAYSHWLVNRFPVRRGATIHLGLMIAVMAFGLPIGIAAGFERPPTEWEAPWLVLLFALSVGLPFFAVSANGPLLQSWFSRTGHVQAHDPYFLYAASNFGSFGALIAYPLLIEPFLPLSWQLSGWSWGFAALFATIVACAGFAVGDHPAVSDDAKPVEVTHAPLVSRRDIFGWVALSFVPSALLVAVTAHISTDIAAAPFLWVAPLGLFLLTFIIVFQRRPVLRRQWMLHAQLGFFALLLVASALGKGVPWPVGLTLHLGLFFATAMVAHGELAASRPDARHLTAFFMWISVGGVLGGLFSGLIAPLIFNSIAEYYLLLGLGLLCRPGLLPAIGSPRRKPVLMAAFGVGVIGFFGLIAKEQLRTDSIRSFFGVHSLHEYENGQVRVLAHGNTMHGAQRIRDANGQALSGLPEPLTYYYFGGPMSEGIEAVRERLGGKLGPVAAIGLGSGSLACHRRDGESWSFYEIDRDVVRIAKDPKRFSFLSSCAPDMPIILGDGRLTLADAPDGHFDLIVVDAFSSDAIPVHLLTVEALDLYKRKLSQGGGIVLHLSNRNLELVSVAAATAREAGLSAVANDPYANAERRADPFKSLSQVVMVARQPDDLAPLLKRSGWSPAEIDPKVAAWSDDYSGVLGALIRKMGW